MELIKSHDQLVPGRHLSAGPGYPTPVVALLLVSLLACDQMQEGKIHATGFFTIGLTSNALVRVSEGYAVRPDSQPAEANKTKLMLLILPPLTHGEDLESGGSGMKNLSKTRTSYWHYWSFRNGQTVRFEYEWDRELNLLVVGKSTSKIEDGNVFAVAFDQSWNWKIEQSRKVLEYECGGSDFSLGKECLSEIKKLFPGNERITGLEMNKGKTE